MASPASEPEAEAPRPDALNRLLQGFRIPRLEERPRSIREKDLRVGRLELHFVEGILFPVLDPAGSALGFLYEGTGWYRYRSEDPLDRQLLEMNVARLTIAPLLHNHAVGERFRRLVLFDPASAYEGLLNPPLETGTDPARPAGPARADVRRRAAFEAIWQGMHDTFPLDHLAAVVRLGGGGGRLVHTEIEGEQKTVGYSLDAVHRFEETLFFFRKVQGHDRRFPLLLSTQPIDGGPTAHPIPFVMKHARIAVTTTDNRSASISSDLTFEAHSPGLRVVRLQLMNHRDRTGRSWESDRNRLNLLRVTNGVGRPLPASHRHHEVVVLLEEPPAAGASFQLRFETAGEVLTGIEGERYDNYFDLLWERWHPKPFDDAFFTYALRVTTRKPFRPVVPGTLTAFDETDDAFTAESRSLAPVPEVSIFAGKYAIREEKAGRVTVRVHAHGAARRETMDTMPRLAHAFMGYFERHLGPYPLDELNIVEVPKWGFGMAPAGMVLITSEAYNPYSILGQLAIPGPERGQQADLNISHGVNGRLAHEIAHQWFGYKATPATSRDNWISEAVAEYLAGLALGAARAEEAGAQGFASKLDEWRWFARACRDVGSLESANMLAGEKAWSDRICLLYYRGPLVLHMLRVLGGDERFFAILRRVLERAAIGSVTTEDFRRASEEILAVDLGWFFEQWVRRSGIPAIRVSTRVEESGGRFALTGRAEQEAGHDFKKIHIPIVLEYRDGRRDSRVLFMDEPVEEFRYDLDAKPRSVSVDPFRNNLADYR